jgi:hypothetical protein
MLSSIDLATSEWYSDAEPTPDRQTPTAGGALLSGDPPQFRRFMSGSRPIDLDGIDWNAIAGHPLVDDILRVVAYMQDVESHTVVFPRTLFSRRALEDEYVVPFSSAGCTKRECTAALLRSSSPARTIRSRRGSMGVLRCAIASIGP